MTDTTDLPMAPSDPVVAAAAPFPGPSMSALAMMAGPLLLMIGAALFIGLYSVGGGDRLEAIADHRGRAFAAVNFAMAGIILLVFAVADLSAAVSRQRPRLGRIGGVLTIIGLFGPAFFLGADFLSFQLTDLADRAGAVTAVEDSAAVPNIVNLCGPALIAGLVILAIGAFKSGVLPRSRSWALGVAALAPVGFVSGFMPIAVGAWSCLAIALVPLGLERWRSRAIAPR